ncbi:hypothetical protein HKX54_01880 [Sulfitobacter sp. M57]|uniref:hypothetical protein n=1 Tax=unclassified Sulfitobacter TaxID=196795 RepID=UPI0023E26581|nr:MULTISPECIES: hypothetical protein [unclassified Sulfitobacter]MDF3413191.1 hypothetical protein [Sulfitobacter sp. KE5]MDF3421526.1 hypothetical protein [Sulfitobacter sp. KE43]MDF3431740.1 hypothetical protein [Sulfitobacter sp. KE42]MDF3457380.1 hypothetical protein [Sulfitobacter sp. S74]MDF3461283.1 hypothetical protein [Sulfitobacter sp. Ks18]
MAREQASRQTSNSSFNVVIVGQHGRLAYEALIFAASLRHSSPDFSGRLIVAEPQPGPLWKNDPTIKNGDIRAALENLGAEIIHFECSHFGDAYPYGNKIEMLKALPKGEPFVFFDTDTLITGDLMSVPFDFDRPSASLRREGTWPVPQVYGPGYAGLWKSLYDKFDLDFDSSLDLGQPDEYWRRYLYFNAGFFFYRCPREFGAKFLHYALAIRDTPPVELCAQSFDPWLDQIALPLVIHALGGGRDALPTGYLDGEVSCHYRLLPLLYARESARVIEVLETVTAPNKLKKVLKGSNAAKRMIYQGRGHKVRALFDQDNLPRREQVIRNRIKKNGFWIR